MHGYEGSGLGLIAGVAGILIALVCLFLLRQQRACIERQYQEVTSVNRQHSAECSGKIDALEGSRAALEISAQTIEHPGRAGMMLSKRSQAMQLLRSGMSPDNAAAKLGIARREMRLIAKVSDILSLQ
jgi:hypothetical protein